MRLVTTAATVLVTALSAQILLAQTQKPLKPTAPGTAGDPAWQGYILMSDGRTFVTDGGLAIDAAYAKLPELPTRRLTPGVLEKYLNAAPQTEYGFDDFVAAPTGKTYTAPNGIPLSTTYINYLRRTLPPSARFGMNGDMEPIVTKVDGKAVGVLMPVRK